MALEQIGPRNLLTIGGIVVLTGNLYIWLAVQRMIWSTVSTISLAYFLAQIGISCTTMTATALSIGIFPTEVTGQVAGLSKAYFGISSAVLATISAGFFDSTSTDFILFVALFIPSVLFFAAKNVRPLLSLSVSHSLLLLLHRQTFSPCLFALSSMKSLVRDTTPSLPTLPTSSASSS
jgi:hypothetical protein